MVRDPPDDWVWGAGYLIRAISKAHPDFPGRLGWLDLSKYVIRRIMGFGGLEEKLARLRFDQLYVFSVGGLGFFLAPQTT